MVGVTKSSRTKSLLLLLLTVVIGLGLNFLGRLLNSIFGLPLYLDNVGTILTALTGGIVPCITVGFFSNILNNGFHPTRELMIWLWIYEYCLSGYVPENGDEPSLCGTGEQIRIRCRHKVGFRFLNQVLDDEENLLAVSPR